MGKTEPQSPSCCGRPIGWLPSATQAALASNKRFLWHLLHVERHEAANGTMAAHALGVALRLSACCGRTM